MDDVEVDVVDAETLQAAFDLCNRIRPRRKELGGDEHVLARHAALAQPLPHTLLVAVRLSSVDVPVTELERPPDGIDALAPVRNLPDTEAEQRDLVPVCKHPGCSVFGHHVSERQSLSDDVNARGRFASSRFIGHPRSALRLDSAAVSPSLHVVALMLLDPPTDSPEPTFPL